MDIQTIKKIKKVYHIDIIFNLELINKHLSSINFISLLSNLINLNISFNNIQDLSPLSHLKSLKRLNVSNNKITKLKALCNMQSLQYINLENNNISSFVEISHLSSMRHFPSLIHICFKSIDNKCRNPICNQPCYYQKILDIFKSKTENNKIISIDHQRLICDDTQQSIHKILQEIRDQQQELSQEELKLKHEKSDMFGWINIISNVPHRIIDATQDLQFQMAKTKLQSTIQECINATSQINMDLIKYS